MSRTKTRCLIFALVVLGSGLLFALKRPNSPVHGDEETFGLSVPPDAFNIGTVWENEHFRWTVPVQNTGAHPVDVASISTSCNCLAVEPQAFFLGPGERRELRLEIDLLSQSKATGEITVELFPRLKRKEGADQPKPVGPVWKVSGRLRRVMTLESHVYLGRHSELTQPLPAWKLPIDILVPLKSLTATFDVPGFGVSLELPPGAGKTVVLLTPISPLREGTIKGTVILKPVLKDGESLPERQVRFDGTIVPDIEAVPPVVQVGGRARGETFEEVIVLRSMTGQALAAIPARADAEGDGLSVETLDGKGRYRIRQKVCNTGLQTNRVWFHTELSGRPISLVVPVSYTGLERQ